MQHGVGREAGEQEERKRVHPSPPRQQAPAPVPGRWLDSRQKSRPPSHGAPEEIAALEICSSAERDDGN